MRLSAKAPIVIRGEEITHLDADGYKHLPRATSLPDGKVLATSGGKWGASDLSGVSVASVFGRTGAVAAQTGDYTAAQVGAEPYAGAPAQTSFWRSTAAGVRAWVQLVAADITDLATTLAGYLTKNNPTYTGRLTGPTQYLEADEQIHLAIRRPGGNSGRIHGVAFQAQNDASAWAEFGRVMTYISSVTAGAHTGGMRLIAYKNGAILQALEAGPDGVRVGSGLSLQMGTTPVIDASRNGTLKSLTVDENIFLPNSVTWKSGSTNYFSMYATSIEFGLRDLNDTGSVIAYPLIVKRGVGGEVQIGYSGGLRPVRIGGVLKNDALAGAWNRPLVAGADGTIDDQDAATFLATIGALAASLKGAANGVAELGADVKVPVAQLPSAALLALGADSTTAHRGDHGTTAYTHSQIATGNPHGTTSDDVGAWPRVALGGPIDFHSINGGQTCIAEINGTSYANAPYLGSQLVGYGGTLIQSRAANGNLMLLWLDGRTSMTYACGYGVGMGWGAWLEMSNTYNLPASTIGKAVLAAASRAEARTAIGAAKASSKLDVSASTTIGSIDATAIKVTTTDVLLTLSGGVDGQGWDIVCPTTSFGISIPTGVTLYAYAGSDIGPTTRAVGGGRGIRIVRIDAATWIAPNLTW